MAKSVLELAVDTGKWEGGIRKAQTALNNFTKDQGGLQQALQKNSGKVKDFLSIMGNVESKANTAKGKMNDYKTVIAQLDSMQRQLNETDRQAFGADFQRAIDAAREKFRQAKDEVDELNRSLNDVKAPQIGNINVGGGGGLLGGLDLKGMAGGLIGFTSVAGAVMMAANALKGALENNIETAKNFEVSMSHLSSLTGLTGEKLDYLKQKAIDLGGSTTQSASQVAESFMLIGSKMPELLNDADALSQVTEAAIRLAEASGGTVTESANALTASLNIMGEGADQANRYINVLAAGSQKGTRSIDELSTIVFRAGQSAHSSGMSFEELIAIAASGTKEFDSAESAGQGLSKLFVQLEKQGNDKLKPSVVGVTEAIRNLTEANFSQVEAIKLFTVNGAAAYRSIIDNKDAILETLPAITGTNTALEQAATNTANLDGALKNLSSAWEKLNLTLNSSNSELTHAVQKLTDLVNMMTAGVNACKDMSDAWDDAMGAMSTSIANFLRQSGFKELAEYWDKFDKFASGLGFGGEGSKNNTNTNKGTGKKYRNRATGKVGNSVEEVRTVVYKGADGKIYKTLEEARKAGNKTVTKTYDDSTLKGIRAHINALKEERLKVDADSQAYANLTAEITRLEAKLKNPKTPKATKTEKTEEQLNTEKIRKLTEEYRSATDDRKTAIQEEIRALQVRNDEIKRLNDEAMGILKPLRKDEQATYTVTVDKSQLDDLKKELPEDATIVETVKIDAPASVEIPVNVEQPEPVKVDAPDKVTLTITADTASVDKSINDILRRYDGVKREVESKPMQMQVGYAGASSAAIDAWIKSTKDSLSKAEFGTDLYNSLTANLADVTSFKNLMEQWVKAGLDASQFPSEELWEKIIGGDGDVIPDETWQNLINEINAKLATISDQIEPITINFKTGDISKVTNKVKEVKENGDATADAWRSASDVIGNIGNVFEQIEDPGKKVAGLIAQAIASVASAMAKSLSSSATVWDFIAGAAAGTATMVSTINAIKQNTEYHAGGGIAGMPNFKPRGTDTIPAMLTPGEIILNHAQANNVANDLQQNSNNGGGFQGQPYLQSETIWLGVGNHLKRTGQGEIITSKNIHKYIH